MSEMIVRSHVVELLDWLAISNGYEVVEVYPIPSGGELPISDGNLSIVGHIGVSHSMIEGNKFRWLSRMKRVQEVLFISQL